MSSVANTRECEGAPDRAPRVARWTLADARRRAGVNVHAAMRCLEERVEAAEALCSVRNLPALIEVDAAGAIDAARLPLRAREVARESRDVWPVRYDGTRVWFLKLSAAQWAAVQSGEPISCAHKRARDV